MTGQQQAEPADPPTGDLDAVSDRLLEVSARLDQATTDLRRLVARMRTTLEGDRADA